MKIILSTPRGFCAGVFNAVDIVEKCLDTFGKPIYILKEIVHNKTVVDRLTQKGAHSIQSIDEAPENSYLVFSAHGVPPQFHQLAKNRNIKVIDAFWQTHLYLKRNRAQQNSGRPPYSKGRSFYSKY
jgi:4-hydroxy-3-methylbut-2-enyl diphosphate reductase